MTQFLESGGEEVLILWRGSGEDSEFLGNGFEHFEISDVVLIVFGVFNEASDHFSELLAFHDNVVA